jgi:hypothetical protein
VSFFSLIYVGLWLIQNKIKNIIGFIFLSYLNLIPINFYFCGIIFMLLKCIMLYEIIFIFFREKNSYEIYQLFTHVLFKAHKILWTRLQNHLYNYSFLYNFIGCEMKWGFSLISASVSYTQIIFNPTMHTPLLRPYKL